MDVQCCQSMVDSEQWLPPAAAAADLLSEDSSVLVQGGGAIGGGALQAGIMGCGCGWSSLGPLMDSSSSSYNNSPVESVVGSTETESEEDDDYMADLALQMAHSMLLDDDDDYKDSEEIGQDFHWLSPQMKSKEDESAKSYMMSRSPQSILAVDGVDSKGSSKVSSSPSAVENPETWDLLFAAAAAAAAGAGEVMRHSMAAAVGTKTVPLYAKAVHGPYNTSGYDSVSASALYLDNGYHSSSNCFSGYSPKEKMTNNSSPFGSHGVWSDKAREEDMKFHSQHHLQHQRQPKQSQSRGQGWVRQAKSMQFQHQHVHYRSGSKPPGINNSSGGGRSLRSDYPNPAWPPLKQAVGSGMRAVFLGSRGSGRESGGTGVFLPRRSGCNSDLRRKPPCSTVLLPSRIVHALNLNVEEISSQPNSNSGLLYNHRDALLSTPGASHGGNNTGRLSNYSRVIPRDAAPDYQKSPCFSSLSQIQGASHEIVLPQEWTY